jgi:membrane protease subunit HflC
MLRIGLIIVAVLAFLIAVNNTLAPFFVVNERQTAIKLFLGEIEEQKYGPGLHVKWPVVNTVHTFDQRIMNIDAAPERVLTSEKKNVIVDSFVKWRIDNPQQYFKATGGNSRNAERLLSQFINKGIKDSIGKRSMQDVIAGQRQAIMQEVAVATNRQSQPLGIEIVDVRVKKVELPEDVSDSVYRRMQQERAEVAKDFRSKGQEKAKGIVADAERQRSELLAEAYNESQQIRGQADAEAAEIYAKAYGKNPEFYSLYRSLNAYKTTFSGKNDVLLIKPDSQFFRYFNGDAGN